MTYKGSRHRTDSEDFKKYQNSKIWDNFTKNKTEKEFKKRLLAEGRIDLIEVKKK